MDSLRILIFCNVTPFIEVPSEWQSLGHHETTNLNYWSDQLPLYNFCPFKSREVRKFFAPVVEKKPHVGVVRVKQRKSTGHIEILK